MSLDPAELRRRIREAPGHLLIEAGAGAGKTYCLVDKIRYELGWAPDGQPTTRLEPDQLVAITFTRKAAAELRDRVRRSVLAQALGTTGVERERLAQEAWRLEAATICTLDSFAVDLVRRYGVQRNLSPDLAAWSQGQARPLIAPVLQSVLETAVSEGDQGALVLVRQFGIRGALGWLEDAVFSPDALWRASGKLTDDTDGLGWAKTLEALDLSMRETDTILEPLAAAVIRFAMRVQDSAIAVLLEQGGLTLEQLQVEALRLLTLPAVQADLQQRIRLVCVDEHQDTNRLQAEMLFRLVGLPQKDEAPIGIRSVFVGDAKQGIYGFRGADITMWRRTARYVMESGGEILRLPTNYRSHPRILTAIDALCRPILNNGKPAHSPINAFEVSYQPLQAARDIAGPGGAVGILVGEDGGVESAADQVCAHIASVLASRTEWPVAEGTQGLSPRPIQPKDIAILVRQLAGVADKWQAAADAYGFRLQIRSGQQLWLRREVRDLQALISLLVDRSDREAWMTYLRSPLAGVDDAVITRVLQTPDPLATLALEPTDSAAYQVSVALARWRALAGRVAVADLLRLILDDTGFIAFAAGQPEGDIATRAIEKVIELAETASQPLEGFVRHLQSRLAAADRDEGLSDMPVDPDSVQLLTIHGAKGLEWPMVILPELDRRVIGHKVEATAPRFDRSFGLVLALDAVTTSQESLPASAVWEHVRQQQTLATYAEAKRLYYVGLTRARDYLWLQTTLKAGKKAGEIEKPFAVASNVDWMHLDGMDRWVRFALPLLCSRATDQMLVGPTDTGVTITVARRARGTPKRTAPQASWPVLMISDGAGEADHVGISALASPVPAPGQWKRLWSATELKVFREEPWKHWWRYRASVSTPQLPLDEADRRLVLTPSVRGTILHQYFSEHTPEITTEQRIERLTRLLRRQLQVPAHEMLPMIERLLTHVHGLETAGVPQMLASAKQVRWSVPFTVPIDGPDTQLTGEFDLLWQDNDNRWHVLDFKTLEVLDPVEDVDTWIIPRVAEHELQLALYTYALQMLVGVEHVGTAGLCFTYWGKLHHFAVTPTWVARWKAEALTLIHQIRTGQYGERPIYRASVCGRCEVRRICRPEGDPLLLAEGGDASPALQSEGIVAPTLTHSTLLGRQIAFL